jgi:hypothetical protein
MIIDTKDLVKNKIEKVDFEILRDLLTYKVEYRKVHRDIEISNGKYNVLVALGLCEVSVYQTLCYLLGDKKMTPLQCMILINDFVVYLEI